MLDSLPLAPVYMYLSEPGTKSMWNVCFSGALSRRSLSAICERIFFQARLDIFLMFPQNTRQHSLYSLKCKRVITTLAGKGDLNN